MGNAKRSKTTKVSADVKAKSHGIETKLERPAAPITPLLSKGQLNTLILLAFAVSRILQIGGARTQLETISSDSSNEACVVHLEEDACRDTSILSLLTVKYESSLYLLTVAMAGIIANWYSPLQLLRLNSVMVIAPLFLIVSALSLLHALAPSTKTSNILVAAVLIVLAAPTDYRSVAFIHGRRSHVSRGSRLPSLALVVLFMVKGREILDQANRCMELWQATATPSASDSSASLSLKSPVLTMMVFILIDRVTEVVLYLFAWYEQERWQQSTTMLLLALIQGTQYYLQNSRSNGVVEGVSGEDGSGEMNRSLVLAVLCGLAWLAPEMSLGKRKSS